MKYSGDHISSTCKVETCRHFWSAREATYTKHLRSTSTLCGATNGSQDQSSRSTNETAPTRNKICVTDTHGAVRHGPCNATRLRWHWFSDRGLSLRMAVHAV